MLYNKALANVWTGDVNRALHALQQGVLLHPGHVPSITLLGSVIASLTRVRGLSTPVLSFGSGSGLPAAMALLTNVLDNITGGKMLATAHEDARHLLLLLHTLARLKCTSCGPNTMTSQKDRLLAASQECLQIIRQALAFYKSIFVIGKLLTVVFML